MIEVENVEHHNEIVASAPKCVIFFGSKNCFHCRDMESFLQQHISEYPGIEFAHVEITKVPVKDLKAVPVFFLYHNGELFDYQVGAGKERLDRLIRALMRKEDYEPEDDAY
jgi:hypothetical protein